MRKIIRQTPRPVSKSLLLALSLLTSVSWAGEPRLGADSPSQDEPRSEVSMLSRIGWQSLHWEASNFWITASSRIRLDEVTADTLSAQTLPENLMARVADGGKLLLQRTDSRIASNIEFRTAWMNPEPLAMLQRSRLSYGNNQSRIKHYRQLDTGIYRERRESRETSGPYQEAQFWTESPIVSPLTRTEDWTVSSRQILQRPPGLNRTRALLSPPLLLPAISLFVAEKSARQKNFIVQTDLDFFRVIATKKGFHNLNADHTLTAADGKTTQVKGKVRALTVQLEVIPFADSPDEPFELLGLKAPLTVLVEPESLIPLRLEGKAPRLGASKVRLKAAQLAADL